MVHRAPDSRLLTNLIAHEKEYTKHLASLFPLSHSALASLSAYAAASPFQPASPAQSIATVVDVLASADDALQRYNQAVETWREQLASLKDLEDDLTAVLRDRDILVTRLIKASKSTRDTHRSSRLITPLTGLGSVSLSSLPSTNSTTTGSGSGSGPASTNAKLAQAQAELQACEAHLVAKERELDARRVSIAREGLGARCRALIDCGWVWGEMGKQGLKALQALSTNGVASSSLTAIPPHLGLNPNTYPSDSSSLTPSQSASQTAARSVETSHEGTASKQHGHTTEPEAELKTKSQTPTGQARTTRAEEEGDLTITLPPAHSISELAFPTGFRSQPPHDGDSAVQKQATSNSNPAPTPVPRRKRTKPPRRPPSQHITEVSDEGSDGPSSVSYCNTSVNVTTNTNTNPSIPRTTFPTTRAARGTHDTSSEDEHPVGPLEVVENDPFEVIRKSMLGPSASAPVLPTDPSTPSSRISGPDVRGDETSPFKPAFPSSGSRSGVTPSSGSPKRERRTSIAFFGSIRGLFRKPKDKDRVGAEWDEGHSSPSHSSPSRTNAKANGRGGVWVTRTDARIKGSRGGAEDSDSEAMPTQTGIVTTTSVANVERRASGARLRKGRPSASRRGIHGNGSSPSIPTHRLGAGVKADGSITDSPAGAGAGSGAGTTTGAGQGRSRTRRGTIKQKKTSVADLRGSDQGHTDGEVDNRGVRVRQSLERVSSDAPEVPVSVSGPKLKVDIEEEGQLAHRGSTSKGVLTDTDPTADPNINTNASTGTQHRRAMTTTAPSSRKPLLDGSPTHRRSASLSLAHTHAMLVSTSTQATPTIISTERSISWRKPPPPVDPPSQPESPSESQIPSHIPSRTQTESQPKHNARRQLTNGQAAQAYKHAQNQSLMSIVADVARQNENEIQGLNRDRVWLGVGVDMGTDKMRSLDIPRAPGSVLRDDRELPSAEKGMGTGVNGRAHARTSSSPMAMDEGGRGSGQVGQGPGQEQGGQRPIKLPLRSALRNASRTPSPSPASVIVSAPVTSPAVVPVVNDWEVEKEGVVLADAQLVQLEEDRGREIASPVRDSASISSYETTRESFAAEGEAVSSSPSSPRSQSPFSPLRSRSHSPAPRSQSPTPRSHTPPLPPLTFTFPPPPVDPPPVSVSVPVRGETTQSSSNPNTIEQPSSSNASTETQPVRRKSVRMSLQPTFSPTPPALYDEDGEGYAPWSRSFSTHDEGGEVGRREGEHARRAKGREGRNTRKGLKGSGSGDAQEDMWADSSEEDEVYSHARRLLSLVGKHDKAKGEGGKGKGKARAQT
ncbi:hypothetical protein J3R82DRAFT_3438 [Butyriboletus roseoflavus]|nr:hypothetical protein J3R82DRAFT_3438 [Butyriboletus roseoflavus]